MSELVLEKNDQTKLPSGWKYATIGEITENSQYGWTTSASNIGKIKLLRTTDITKGTINWKTVPFCKSEPKELEKYLLYDEDIVISRAGSIGVSHLIKNPEKAVFASYLIRFKPLIDPTYLSYFLQSPTYWDSIKEKSVGIALPNVNATKLRQILIPIPPLNEQKRIVAKIEELFSDLEHNIQILQKIKLQLKEYKQSILANAFNGNLTMNWRKKHSSSLGNITDTLKLLLNNKKEFSENYLHFIPNDLETLPKLPSQWVWSTVGLLAKSMKNGIYKPKSFYSERGIACLRMYNIEDGELVWKNIKRMNLSPNEILEYELLPNDLLVNRVNSRELVGKTARIPDDIERCVYESKNIRLHLFNDFANSALIAYWFQFFRQVFFNRNAQQTVGMASINQEQLGIMPIPYMHISEQKELVKQIEFHFSIIKNSTSLIENNLKHLYKLKNSIFRQAFEGKLVPQDPHDEPANVLLARIKREKEKLQKTHRIIKSRTTKQRRIKNDK